MIKNLNTFANRLKFAMDERNINQTELSILTGIGKPSLSQYLSGKNIPRKNVIHKLADALGCSTAFLNGATQRDDLPMHDEPQCNNNVSVADAAKLMGKSEQYIRRGLQQQRLPFGSAVMGEKEWSYHISPKLFDAYMNGWLYSPMKTMRKDDSMPSYRTCPECGSSIDPEEKCDCTKEEKNALPSANSKASRCDKHFSTPRNDASIIHEPHDLCKT